MKKESMACKCENDVETERCILENELTNIMREIGFPVNIRGSWYLRKAILMTIEDIDLLGSVTKTIYPILANTFQTTVFGVERAIRHAIGVAWLRGNEEAIYRLFGYTVDRGKGKPTNSECIAIIVDTMIQRYRNADRLPLEKCHR